MYTKDQIAAATDVDIVDYCHQNGIDLTNNSERYYRSLKHDSLVIDRRENSFYWNSKGKSGNIINFLKEYEGLSFAESMSKLTDTEIKYEKKDMVEYVHEPYVYNPENESSSFFKARNYLINERKIDPSIIDNLHDQGLIKQDNRNNVLFIWKEYEHIMGCSEQGTVKSSNYKRGAWKSEQKNSTSNYGFNILNGEPKNLKFFESPIDLLSYATLHKNSIENTQLISMSGLKHNTVFNYAIAAKERLGDYPDSISFCVDNDNGGQTFIDKFKGSQYQKKDGSVHDYKSELPPNKEVKDWNDQLKLVCDQQLLKRNLYLSQQIDR